MADAATEKQALTQHAYASGVLAAAQFRELEDLQTEHPTFIAEVVSTFEEEARSMLTELRTRLTAASGVGGSPAGVADINAARAVLHKLKGSALTLGAAAVGACCDAVRQHCLAGDMAALHAPGGSLAMLEVATQQVLDTLNRYIALQMAIVNAGV